MIYKLRMFLSSGCLILSVVGTTFDAVFTTLAYKLAGLNKEEIDYGNIE